MLIRMYWIAILSLLVGYHAYGQGLQNGNLWLESQTYSTERSLSCFISADLELLSDYLEQNNGRYMHSFRGKHLVHLPGNKLKELTRKHWVKQVYLEGGGGTPLLDTSKVNTRTNLVHAGQIKGHPKFLGDGVLVGIIDTGIDLDHADFKDEKGKTRVIKIWDQLANNDSTRRPTFGYGEVYDSTEINAGACPHVDPNYFHGHGTQVSGVVAGNGLSVHDSIANYKGHAPNSSILFVASDFNRANWTVSVAEAVDWIFAEADKLGMPCVINISAGTYLGSHDGKDMAAQYIDSLVALKSGRVVVAAAGNAGNQRPFHLRTSVQNDTAFTWFDANSRSSFGNAVFIEGWADTSELSGLQLGFGYTNTTNWTDSIYYLESIKNRLNVTRTQNVGSNSVLTTWAERRDNRYLFQILLTNPTAGLKYKLLSVGIGSHDIWGSSWLGVSDIVSTGLPPTSTYSKISKYQLPDTLQSIVTSWNCSPNVISVGNYNNRYQYKNIDDSLRITRDLPVGSKGASSSRGPNRLGVIKPDIMAPGNFTVTSARIVDAIFVAKTASVRYKLAKGGFHLSNGGTSMSAPAVAGIVALYLEKCPHSTADRIKSDLLSRTILDNFTGTMANNEYGYGKVDAFATLSATNINEKLVAGSKTVLCPGEQVTIQPKKRYDQYLWNDGSTGSNYISDTTDTVSVTVWSSEGCKGQSDTMIVKSVPSPRVQIHSKSDSVCTGKKLILHVDGAQSYNWSDGSQKDSLVVTKAGIYSVEGTDSNVCSGADTLFVREVLCNVGVDEQLKKNRLIMFPNPVTKTLTIHWAQPLKSPVHLLVYDISGKQVLAENVLNGKQSVQLDVEDLPAGVYSLQVSDQHNRYSYQFVRSK